MDVEIFELVRIGLVLLRGPGIRGVGTPYRTYRQAEGRRDAHSPQQHCVMPLDKRDTLGSDSALDAPRSGQLY